MDMMISVFCNICNFIQDATALHKVKPLFNPVKRFYRLKNLKPKGWWKEEQTYL